MLLLSEGAPDGRVPGPPSDEVQTSRSRMSCGYVLV